MVKKRDNNIQNQKLLISFLRMLRSAENIFFVNKIIMASSGSSLKINTVRDMEDTEKNTLPEVRPPDMNFQYADLFEFDNEPTIEDNSASGPDTVDEIRADVYESIYPDEPEQLLEGDMESLPPDTVENAPVFTRETEMFFRFLIDNGLTGRTRKNHVGISLDTGAKFDVVLEGKNEVKFECDIPIEVDGEIAGVRCFDMQFSDLTGECSRFSWHDVCFYESGSFKRKLFNEASSQLPVPEWQDVLAKFTDALKTGN